MGLHDDEYTEFLEKELDAAEKKLEAALIKAEGLGLKGDDRVYPLHVCGEPENYTRPASYCKACSATEDLSE